MSKRQTVLDVRGMTCGSCVRHVEKALRQVAGVEHADVQLGEGKVRVQHDASSAPVESLVRAIVDAGYEANEAPAV